MSYYYKYNFVSPEPIYALIKEELSSYFDTGAIDDTLFPIYTDKCLKKLGRGSYKINEQVLIIDNYKARLPEDFISVREAWLCTETEQEAPLPGAEYNQVAQCSVRIDSPDVYCNPCAKCESPDIIHVLYKTTHKVLFKTRKKFLLTPGNISVKDSCSADCANFGVSSPESFDIRDNKFVVTFPQGEVYLIYYTKELTEEGYQLIPDNVRVQECIESYIKYKMFEKLSNIVTDETFNQIENKKQYYNNEYYEKLAIAETEMKKETAYQKRQASLRTMNRNNKYEIR